MPNNPLVRHKSITNMDFSKKFLLFFALSFSLEVLAHAKFNGVLKKESDGSSKLSPDLNDSLKRHAKAIKTSLITVFGMDWNEISSQVKTCYDAIEGMNQKGSKSKDVLINIYKNIGLLEESISKAKTNWISDYPQLFFSMNIVRIKAVRGLEANPISDICSILCSSIDQHHVLEHSTPTAYVNSSEVVTKIKESMTDFDKVLITVFGPDYKSQVPKIRDVFEEINVLIKSGSVDEQVLFNIYKKIENMRMYMTLEQGPNRETDSPQLLNMIDVLSTFIKTTLKKEYGVTMDSPVQSFVNSTSTTGTPAPTGSPTSSKYIDENKLTSRDFVINITKSISEFEKVLVTVYGPDYKSQVPEVRNEFEEISVLIKSGNIDEEILVNVFKKIENIRMYIRQEIGPNWEKDSPQLLKVITTLSTTVKSILKKEYSKIVGSSSTQSFVNSTSAVITPASKTLDSLSEKYLKTYKAKTISLNILKPIDNYKLTNRDVIVQITQSISDIQNVLINIFGPDYKNKVPKVGSEYEQITILIRSGRVDEEVLVNIFKKIENIRMCITLEKGPKWETDFPQLFKVITTLSTTVKTILKKQYSIKVESSPVQSFVASTPITTTPAPKTTNGRSDAVVTGSTKAPTRSTFSSKPVKENTLTSRDVFIKINESVFDFENVLLAVFGSDYKSKFPKVGDEFDEINVLIKSGSVDEDVLVKVFKKIEKIRMLITLEKGPNWETDSPQLLKVITTLSTAVKTRLKTEYSKSVESSPIQSFVNSISTTSTPKITTSSKPMENSPPVDPTLVKIIKDTPYYLSDAVVNAFGSDYLEKNPIIKKDLENINVLSKSDLKSSILMAEVFDNIELIRLHIREVQGAHWNKSKPHLKNFFTKYRTIMLKSLEQDDFVIKDESSISESAPIDPTFIKQITSTVNEMEDVLIKVFDSDWKEKFPRLKKDYEKIYVLLSSRVLTKAILIKTLKRIKYLRLHIQLQERDSNWAKKYSNLNQVIETLLKYVINTLKVTYEVTVIRTALISSSFESPIDLSDKSSKLTQKAESPPGKDSNVELSVAQKIRLEMSGVTAILISTFGENWSSKVPNVERDYESINTSISSVVLNRQILIDVFARIEYIKLHIGEDIEEKDWMSKYPQLANAIEALSNLVTQTLKIQYRTNVNKSYHTTSEKRGRVEVVQKGKTQVYD